MRLRILWWTALPLFTMAVAMATVAAGHGLSTRVRFPLAGPAIEGVVPRGEVRFRSDDDRQRLLVRVGHVNLDEGTMLDVFLDPAFDGTFDGTMIGSIELNNEGAGRLRLRSDDGDTVPAVSAQSRVEVRQGSAVVLSGPPTVSERFRMRARLAPPSPGSPSTGISAEPKGHADFRSRAFGFQRRLSIEVERVPAGTILEVFVDVDGSGPEPEVKVGSFTMPAGEGEFDIRTRRGDDVPEMDTDSTVVLRDQADGSVVLVTGGGMVNSQSLQCPPGSGAPAEPGGRLSLYWSGHPARTMPDRPPPIDPPRTS